MQTREQGIVLTTSLFFSPSSHQSSNTATSSPSHSSFHFSLKPFPKAGCHLFPEYLPWSICTSHSFSIPKPDDLANSKNGHWLPTALRMLTKQDVEPQSPTRSSPASCLISLPTFESLSSHSTGLSLLVPATLLPALSSAWNAFSLYLLYLYLLRLSPFPPLPLPYLHPLYLLNFQFIFQITGEAEVFWEDFPDSQKNVGITDTVKCTPLA